MSDDTAQQLRSAIAVMPDGMPIAWPCIVRSELLLKAAVLIEWQNRHIDLLQSKVNAEKSCACAYDNPDDVCVAHSPQLVAARAEVERLQAENEQLREALITEAEDRR